MSLEISVLIFSSIVLLFTPFLIMLNHVRVQAEKESNIIDYIEYIEQKSKGDSVDKLIAEQLNIKDIAA